MTETDHIPSKPSKVNHVHRLEIGDNVFWLLTWCIVAAAIVAILLSAMRVSAAGDELTAKSPDPIATRCALASQSTVSQQCLALLTQKREN